MASTFYLVTVHHPTFDDPFILVVPRNIEYKLLKKVIETANENFKNGEEETAFYDELDKEITPLGVCFDIPRNIYL